MTGSNGQLAFDLGHRPAFGRADFLRAASNAEAVAWLERWPDWPAHALALHGPAGCGKTHLLAAFAESAEAVARVDACGLSAEAVPGLVESARVVVVDRLDALADEAALFHLWNLTKETGRFLLLAGRQAPARRPVRLPDLASRLAATQAIGIGAPDDSLLAAVLVKLFADRQLKVGAEVVTFLLGRIERSFAAIGAVVDALDRASLSERRAVTVPLARAVLEREFGDLPPP
ncbi:DNA replication protein [Magnetospirillum sp. UT-4]|uniref:HdaA/DnaA family protein n=1 Tax=Magnetospirillum sp. UT-4 TaxID=2681467 RepID=UPI00137F171A|nr:DNA replication protein [Magnetospirillum sp. UT-4]CAA7627199.1 putative chromosomal replication initiator, DnaA-homolog protein [Magnetospirillum sp. UT-4]